MDDASCVGNMLFMWLSEDPDNFPRASLYQQDDSILSTYVIFQDFCLLFHPISYFHPISNIYEYLLQRNMFTKIRIDSCPLIFLLH